MNIAAYCRLLLRIVLVLTFLALVALTWGPSLLDLVKRHPFDSLLVAAILIGSAILVILYVGELLVLGWIVDFIDQIGMPKPRGPVPLEFEQFGQTIVVAVPEIVATVRDCRSMQEQLKGLIDAHHCDFVFDFSRAEKLSRHFRQVLLYATKAARKKAWNLGVPARPFPLPFGAKFKVFEDRQRALETMAKHEGHGWVVLCGVPFGLRALSKLT
jgi:hypothetical protein